MRLVTLLLAASAAGAPQPAIDPAKVAMLTTPVYTAYRDAIAKDAAMPAATTDTERLERLQAIDQAGRTAFSAIRFDDLSDAEKVAARTAIFAEIQAHDEHDLAALKSMLPTTGWFRVSDVGKRAATSAFLIAQHASDLPFQKEVLTRMEPLFGTPELEGQFYGLLYDRVALREGRPQTYGSQVDCVSGHYAPTHLIDPEHVDERRKAAGFKDTEADYLKLFANEPCH